jgi:hypothetical protein
MHGTHSPRHAGLFHPGPPIMALAAAASRVPSAGVVIADAVSSKPTASEPQRSN